MSSFDEALDCTHDVCAISIWPGSQIEQLLSGPDTAGVVTTLAMRSRLVDCPGKLFYSRELLAGITPMNVWESSDPLTQERAARKIWSRLKMYVDGGCHPIDAANLLRNGELWVGLEIMEELLGELEIEICGSPLPSVSDRLRSKGITQIVVFEAEHTFSDHRFWLRRCEGAVQVSLALDLGREGAASLSENLPTHSFQAPVAISQSLRNVIDASPVRSDPSPPTKSKRRGTVSLHSVEGVDAQDMPWVVASALISAGVPTTETDLPSIPIPLSADGKTILIIVPHRAEEAAFRYRLAQHLDEPVVLLRSGRDDLSVNCCIRALVAIGADDPTPFAEALLKRVAAVCPEHLTVAQSIIANGIGMGLRVWLQAAMKSLQAEPALKPLGTSLARIERSLISTPKELIQEIACLLPLQAAHRTSRGRDGTINLSPTVERAAGCKTIQEAIHLLNASGWSPSRPVQFETDQPRIIVVSANRVGAVVADVVMLVRPGTRGFVGTRGGHANRVDVAQQVLYQCLGAARESVFVFFRGHNDLLPWITKVPEVKMFEHLIPPTTDMC